MLGVCALRKVWLLIWKQLSAQETHPPRVKKEKEKKKSSVSIQTIVVLFGLNKIYSFVIIISSTNKCRKHKSRMLI